jgi:hypothetical protein
VFGVSLVFLFCIDNLIVPLFSILSLHIVGWSVVKTPPEKYLAWLQVENQEVGRIYPGKMQSYLQSRRIGFAVQAQIERDRERAALITRSSGLVPQDGSHSNDTGVNPRHTDAATLAEKEVNAPAAGSLGADLERQISLSSSTASSSDGDQGPAAYRTHTVATQYTARAALGHSLTGIHARDRATHEGKGSQVFVVGWEGPNDPANPRNWTVTKRVCCTLQISIIAAAVGCASGIDATILPQAAEDLHVSDVAESLATGKSPR